MTKVAVETVDTVRRRLAIEVPADAVTAEFDRAYSSLRQTAQVPGFRPGRAPRTLLERMFGDRVRLDVCEKLVRASFTEALQEQDIRPVAEPEIVTESSEPGGPLRYSATVQVKPEVVVSGYRGLQAERPLSTVTEADVDRFLVSVQESMAQLVPVTDRLQARENDIAAVDFDARIGDRIIQKLEDQSLLVTTEGDSSSNPIGSRLAGVAVGDEITFDVDYPADYPGAEVAGRTVTFRARLRGLSVKDLPVLDDEFAKDHGECDTLNELRERVRERLRAAAVRDADRAVRAALVAKLVAANPIEVPPAMVERRLDARVEEVLKSMGAHRPPISREAEARDRIRGEIENRVQDEVRASLLLDAIAVQEEIAVTEEDIVARIEQMVQVVHGDAGEQLRGLYREPPLREDLRLEMRRERALDLVFKEAALQAVESEDRSC